MRLRPLALACLLLTGAPAWSASMGSAFTYQGNLNFNSSPASGNFDFQFALYIGATGGTAVDTLTLANQTVKEGLINASLDFTDVPFNGQALWIEVRVRPAGSGTYTTLLPRQALTATPYALFALAGNQGPAGPKGATGTQGPVGAQGVAGATGSQGPQGPAGVIALPFNGNGADPSATIAVTNSGTGNGLVGQATSAASGVYGGSANGAGYGVAGRAGAGSGIGAPTRTGVLGDSDSGIGILGLSSSKNGVQGASNTGSGVYGATKGVSGASGAAGVWGNTHDYYGVWGTSVVGDGVHGNSTSASGTYGLSASGAGAWGESTGYDGVHGHTSNPNGNTSGVAGFGDGNNNGVAGLSSTGTGVYGTSSGGDGVYGISNPGRFVNGDYTAGVHAVGSTGSLALRAEGDTSLEGFLDVDGTVGVPCCTNVMDVRGNALINGSLSVQGDKNFVEPHPTDPSKEIVYTALEGPESGTYFRGTGRIQNGLATIAVPDSFRLVSSKEGLTVQLTPMGDFSNLSVIKEGLDEIIVKGTSDVSFHFFVQGVRAGFEDHQTIRENTHFIAHGDFDKTLQSGLTEVARRLQANGTLNADGSTNLKTAHELGWDMRSDWNVKSPQRMTSAGSN